MSRSPLIEVSALNGMLGSSEWVLLDCRFDLASPQAGARAFVAGHIPGARYAHLDRDLSGPVRASSGRHPLPDRVRLSAWLGSLGVRPGVSVVAYDEANAAYAARAWWLLRWLGHEDVAVLDGGLRAWLAAGGALESGEAPRPPPPAHASPLPAPPAGLPSPASARPARASAPTPSTVEAAEVLQACNDPRRLIVDARGPERFAGDVEPIDPIAGHVPGAVNHPFQNNLTGEGCFLPPQELARRWRQRLGNRSPEDVIMMCGSGVTACQNLLALEAAGMAGARLYAGSWSEWIRDPARPVERGPERRH